MEDITDLIQSRKENELKDKTIKLAEEFFEKLKVENLTYRECILVTEVLHNSLIRQGNEYLNSQLLSSLVKE